MLDTFRSSMDALVTRIGESRVAYLRRSLWVLIPASILLIDIVLRWQGGTPADFAERPSYLLSSVGLSVGLWWALSRLVAGTQRPWIWGALASLPFALPIAMSWQYQTVVHKDVNTGVLLYLVMEPKTTLDLGATGWSLGFTFALLGLWAFWTTCLAWSQRPDEESRVIRLARGAAILFWLVAVVLWPRPNPVTGAHYVSDVHVGTLVASVGETFATQNVSGSAIGRAEDRADVEAKGLEPQDIPSSSTPNIVVFLGETLIKRRMSLYGYERTTTPEMAHFAREHADEVFHFDHAYANSPYTPLSDAASLSGVAPYRSRETLHRAPMLWEYGRAVGSTSFLLTSKRWSWSNMQLFFLADDEPDLVETGDTIPAEVVNGGGIDDRLLSPRFRRMLEEDVDRSTSVTGVLQTNATHYPYLVPDRVDWSLEASPDRYDAALTIVDGVFGDMVDALEATNRLDNTIIVVVPDHREPFYDITGRLAEKQPEALTPDLRGGQRIESCHPTITRIPMFMYVPESLRDAMNPAAVEALQHNRNRVVSTLDIVPTLIDIVEQTARTDVTLESPVDVDGTSLLDSLDKGRTALCVTEPGWETTLKSGIGVFGRDSSFYIREDFQTPYVFDPSEPIRSNHPTGGRPASDEDWAWIADAARRNPQIVESLHRVADRSSYPELAERLRSIRGE